MRTIALRRVHQALYQVLVFFLGVCGWSVNAEELPLLPEIDAFKPIMIEAGDLTAAKGIAIDRLSLVAIIDDMPEPVPYQIDEYNEGGALYFEGWDVPLVGKPKIFDGDDKLLFLYKDTGPRRRAEHIFDGEVVAEIELAGDDGVKRYAYLVKDARLVSDEQYVRYSAEYGRVETDFYTLTYDPENHLNWKEFFFENYQGENPLDSMKLRLKAGLLTSLTPTELNNNDMVAKPTGVRIGPIRTTTQLSVTVWIMNLPVLKLSSQLHHYPKRLHYDVRVVIPEVRRKLLVDPVLTMTIDANNLYGATVRSALGPKQPGIVDGKLDQFEKQMLEAGVTEKDSWLWVSTQRNLDLIAYFDYLGDTNEPLSLFFKDDKNEEDPPEKYKGQLPNLGYTVESFPDSGLFGYVVSMMFSDGFEGQPEEFTLKARTAPEIIVRSEPQ